MKNRTPTLVSGHFVIGTRNRQHIWEMHDSVPHVSLRRDNDSTNRFLTPEEARRLAAALIAEAEYAETRL